MSFVFVVGGSWYFVVKSFDFLLEGNFLHLQLRLSDLDLRFLLIQLLNGFIALEESGFQLSDILFVSFLNSGFLFWDFLANVFIFLSKGLN